MTATTGRASFRFIPLKGSWNSIPHPMVFKLLILNNTQRRLIFWSIVQVLMTILLHLPLPLCINFTSTLSTRTLRVVQKNKYNKLRALVSLWAWFPVPPNVISKPWYISICSKTALSQTMTFAMLATSMALIWHQSEARQSGRSLREWSLITLRFQNKFCQFTGTSPCLQMSCLSTLFHFWSQHLVALI
jgi:hypothetical protein